MQSGQWDISLDHTKQTVLAEIYLYCRAKEFTIYSSRGKSNSSAGLAAVVAAIAHKHALHLEEQSIFISRAGFANHLQVFQKQVLKQLDASNS